MLSERSYTTIISPVISEKSAIQKTNSNTYVFKVAKDADKKEITSSIEDIFGVKVSSVRVLNTSSKTNVIDLVHTKQAHIKKLM